MPRGTRAGRRAMDRPGKPLPLAPRAGPLPSPACVPLSTSERLAALYLILWCLQVGRRNIYFWGVLCLGEAGSDRSSCEHTFGARTMGGGPAEKQCKRCGQLKPLTEFHRWRDRHQSWCKPCRAEYAAAHYQKNKARRQAQNKARQAEFMAWYVSLKVGRPCVDCGGEFHPAAMQWDHLPGQGKTANLSFLARRGNRDRVLEEIARCELVCANCHATRSYRRRDSIPMAHRENA